jgi:REP element-mobilizing transposase RayT
MWWISDPPYIFLDAFVMMPNHVHGIVVIAEGEVGAGKGKALIV